LDVVGEDREDAHVSPNPTPETIGQRLRRLRAERGLSQRELAAPGVSYAYISRIEAGTRQPSVKALRKLAAKLGVSPDYLETGADLRSEEERELRIADAELELRIGRDVGAARERLRGLLQEATSAADPASAARARIALGFAASLEGRHDEAVGELEPVVEGGFVSPTTNPDVYTTLGRAYAFLGQTGRAVELFEECLSRVDEEASQDVVARTRFATLLSYALTDAGELDRAEKIVIEALDAASEIDDVYTQIRLYWSLARLATMPGRPSAALRYARRAVVLLEASEDTLHLARAHQLCGNILLAKGDAARANEHLTRAESLLGASPEPLDLASLRTEQAKAAAALDRGAQAVALAHEALEALDDNDPAERGAALCALAHGLALEQDLAGAGVNFRQGIELLHEHGRWRDVRFTAAIWADVLRSGGRDREAEAVLARYGEAGAVHAAER
jgi:transcriptional regulator with XRE-family HTH domain